MPTYDKAQWQQQQEQRRKDLFAKLREGVRNIISSDTYRHYLLTMGRFHQYSWHNAILIYLQKPNATRVAGFVDWKNKFERFVRKGEHGISILAPRFPGKQRTLEERIKAMGREPTPEELRDLKRQIDDEMSGIAPRSFLVVTVFDVSQTEGKPLPEFDVPVLSGAANESLFAKVMALAKDKGLSVSFESRPSQSSEIKGQLVGTSIWVRPEEPRAQQLKTLLHEVAHYYTEGVFRIPRTDAETIAESVAFVVAGHFSFDTGVRAFPYVALWAKDEKVLYGNMATIDKVSGTMVESLEKLTAMAVKEAERKPPDKPQLQPLAVREPEAARCPKCRKIWDLTVLRKRKDYVPGDCPICKVPLRSIPLRG